MDSAAFRLRCKRCGAPVPFEHHVQACDRCIEKDRPITRYAVMLHVDTADDPIEVAAAIAVALNYQHVGGICVAPAETFSWEDPVPPKGVIRD